MTRPSEGDPADEAALGDGFCSAIFDAPERPGKSLNPPKPYWGQIWAVQMCAGSTPSHPIHQQVLHIAHEGAATEPASANVQLRCGSRLRAGH